MSRTFERFAGACAIAVGAGGLAYAIAFVVLLKNGSRGASYADDLLLLVGGLLSSAVLVALYHRLREVDAGFALWALVLGSVGALGAAIHGAFDLANLVKTPTVGRGNLPNYVDPRGLLTFAVTGLSLFVVAWLIWKGGVFPQGLAYLGFAGGVLLVIVYLGRLIVLNPKSPAVLIAAVLSGFVVNPAFFIWLGLELRRLPARATGDPAPASRN